MRNHYQAIDVYTFCTLDWENGISPLAGRNRSGRLNPKLLHFVRLSGSVSTLSESYQHHSAFHRTVDKYMDYFS